MSFKEQIGPDLMREGYHSYSSGGFASYVNLSWQAGYYALLAEEIYPQMSEKKFEKHLEDLEQRTQKGEKVGDSRNRKPTY